jgi:hypothetical protein
MIDKQFKRFKSSNEENLVNDSDDILTLSIYKTQYSVVLLINDDNYVKIINSIKNVTSTLTLKVSLITISNWKSYVQISLYMKSSNVRYDQIKNFRNSIELHKTHAFLNSNVI